MIRFEKVSVAIDGRPILGGIDVAIDGPGLVVVFGPSGHGKSTLLKLMTRQLPWRRADAVGRNARGAVLDGTVQVGGRPVEVWDATALRRRVGQCLQEAVMLPGSVQDNLIRPHRAVWPGIRQEARMARATEALARVGLLHEVSRDLPAEALSGGQRQRLSIARAIMQAPQALLFDEPTSALDSLAGRQVFKAMRDLADTLPVVVVTHDLRLAARSDRMIFLARPALNGDGGARVLADGPPAEILGPEMPAELQAIVQAFDSSDTCAA